MYEKFKQLSKESFVYGLGTAAGKAINFLLIPIYTRVFSTQAYGVLDIIIMSTAAIVILAKMGLNTVLNMFFYQAKDEGERKAVISSNFLFLFLATLIIVLLVIFFNQELSLILFKSEIYGKYLIIAALTVLFTTILNFSASLYRLFFKPMYFLYITLGNVILSVILSIYFVIFLKMGLMGALYGLLISAIFFSLISFYFSRNKFTFKISFEKLKEMMKVGLPLAPMGIGIWIMDFSSRYFLVQFQDLNQVGLYGVAYRIAALLGILVLAFRLANVPHQYSMAQDGSAKRFYSKTLTYYFLITFFMVTALSLFSKEILIIFTTPDYIEGYKAIIPLAFSAVFVGLYHVIGLGLILTRKTYFMSLGVLGGVLIVIALNLFLVPHYGFLGAAVANVIAYFVGLILIYFWAQKYYHIDYEIKKILKIWLVTFLLIFLGMSINTETVLLNIVLKILVILLFVIFGYFILEKKEIESLKLMITSFKDVLLRKNHGN